MNGTAKRSKNEPGGSSVENTQKFGKFVFLKISQLHSDGTYQRPVSKWRVDDIVENYEPILYQPLIIGLRDGVYYIVDGQHRYMAAIELGFQQVPCMLYETKSVADEARAFVWLQQYRRRITPAQRFAARLAFKDTAAMSIARALKEYDFEIGDYDKLGAARKNNTIHAIAAVERCFDEGGERRVHDLLYVLRNAWDGRSSALDGRIIAGLHRFMAENAYGHKALADRLRDLPPFELDRAARSVSNSRGLILVDAYAAAIGSIYRKGKA